MHGVLLFLCLTFFCISSIPKSRIKWAGPTPMTLSTFTQTSRCCNFFSKYVIRWEIQFNFPDQKHAKKRQSSGCFYWAFKPLEFFCHMLCVFLHIFILYLYFDHIHKMATNRMQNSVFWLTPTNSIDTHEACLACCSPWGRKESDQVGNWTRTRKSIELSAHGTIWQPVSWDLEPHVVIGWCLGNTNQSLQQWVGGYPKLPEIIVAKVYPQDWRRRHTQSWTNIYCL